MSTNAQEAKRHAAEIILRSIDELRLGAMVLQAAGIPSPNLSKANSILLQQLEEIAE